MDGIIGKVGSRWRVKSKIGRVFYGRMVRTILRWSIDEPERELWLPERELLLAMPRRAWEVLHGIGPLCGGHVTAERDNRLRPKLGRAARRWFTSPCKTAGSFIWVCDLLGLDPDAVRRASYITGYNGAPKTCPRVQHVQKNDGDEKSLARAGQGLTSNVAFSL